MGSRRVLGGLVSLVIPGAGHFAIGRPWRGVAWWSVAAVSVLLLPFVVWMPVWFSMLLVRIVSAIEVAVLRDVRVVKWGRIAAAWGMCVVATFAFTRVVRTYYLEAYTIPAASMAPTLQVGDHIFINKLSDIGPGDVVVFTNPCEPDKDFVKRIVAVGGDSVEVRCGALYVNGDPVPSEHVAGDCAFLDDDPYAELAREISCSGYTETIGGHTYTTAHDPTRPQLLARVTEDPHTPYPGNLRERDFPGTEPPSCRVLGRPAARIGRVMPSVAGDAPGAPCGLRQHYVVPEDHVFVLGDNRYNSSDSRIWGPVPVDHIKGKAFLIWWSAAPGGDIDWSRIDESID